MQAQQNKQKAQHLLERVADLCEPPLSLRTRARRARSTHFQDRLLDTRTVERLAWLLHFSERYLNPRTVRGCVFLWLLVFISSLYNHLVRDAVVARVAERPERMPQLSTLWVYVVANAVAALVMFPFLWLLGFVLVRIAHTWIRKKQHEQS